MLQRKWITGLDDKMHFHTQINVTQTSLHNCSLWNQEICCSLKGSNDAVKEEPAQKTNKQKKKKKKLRQDLFDQQRHISLYIYPVWLGFKFYPFLDSPEAVEGTFDQRRRWSDCADAQADLSLRWSHKSYCRFCRALAYILRNSKRLSSDSALAAHTCSCVIFEACQYRHRGSILHIRDV